MSDTPAWGSPEWKKSIEEHDAETDPKREEKGLPYTKKPKEKPKPKGKPQPPPKKGKK